MSNFSTQETNRGRKEIRNYLMISDIAASIDELQKWKTLNSIGMVESIREVDGKISVEIPYFISSLGDNIKKLMEAIRGHWSIENSLHWILDVTFEEDKSRIRKDNAPANFSVLRHADCKAAAIATRAQIAAAGGRYCFPLPMTGQNPLWLKQWVLNQHQPSEEIFLPTQEEDEVAVAVGKGFEVELGKFWLNRDTNKSVHWHERYLVLPVRSFLHP